MIRVKTGQADVTLGIGDVTLSTAEYAVGTAAVDRRVSLSHEFDDLLNAVSRVAAAALSEDDVAYALQFLSDLRRGLAARAGVEGA